AVLRSARRFGQLELWRGTAGAEAIEYLVVAAQFQAREAGLAQHFGCEEAGVARPAVHRLDRRHTITLQFLARRVELHQPVAGVGAEGERGLLFKRLDALDR